MSEKDRDFEGLKVQLDSLPSTTPELNADPNILRGSADNSVVRAVDEERKKMEELVNTNISALAGANSVASVVEELVRPNISALAGANSVASVVEELAHPNISALVDANSVASVVEAMEEERRKMEELTDSVAAKWDIASLGGSEAYFADLDENQRKWKHLDDLHVDTSEALETFSKTSRTLDSLSRDIADRRVTTDVTLFENDFQKKQDEHQYALIEMLKKQVEELGELNRRGREADEFSRRSAYELDKRNKALDVSAKDDAKLAGNRSKTTTLLTIFLILFTVFSYFYPPGSSISPPTNVEDGISNEVIGKNMDLEVVKSIPQPVSEEIIPPKPVPLSTYAPIDSAPPPSGQTEAFSNELVEENMDVVKSISQPVSEEPPPPKPVPLATHTPIDRGPPPSGQAEVSHALN